ncbi:MAG: histidine phosphatase family protein, partial [Ignavibacteriaceae bacterium]|nr:histidine phosphatase family protein [Ignavibacteriaceae bacterium]
HGDAERSSIKKNDMQRELTPEGKEKFKKAVDGWKILIHHVDHIVSSPYIRTKQTAEILAKGLKFNKDILFDDKLKSGGSTEDLIMIANSLAGNEIIFVGHEPDCSDHLSNLVSSSGFFVDYKKGMIAKVSFNNRVRAGKGTLEFLIPASIF